MIQKRFFSFLLLLSCCIIALGFEAQLDLAQAQSGRWRTVPVGPAKLVPFQKGFKWRIQEAVADRVLVQFTPTIQPQATDAVLQHVKGRLGRYLGNGIFIVELPQDSDIISAATALRLTPGVLAAEPDLLLYPVLVPNDPEYPKQYHLPLIQAPAAWDVTTGAGNVVLAVIDSGVDLQHPDLASRIWQNSREIPANGVDDDGNGYVDDVRGWNFYDGNNNPRPTPDGKDNNGDGIADEQASHGTLVAGIAAAVGNEGWGTAGVTWGAQIMALKVFPDDGGTAVSTVIEAVNYAVANGAHIINLSMGGGYSNMFTAPFKSAYQAGVLIVCAGGNSGITFTASPSTWESPVCNDGPNLGTDNFVFGVGATDRQDKRSWYSNVDGSPYHFIDVMAPGDDIYGPVLYMPSVPGFNKYFGTNSGTSFSAPMAAGLAALLKGLFPSATPAQLMAMIASNADNIDAINPGLAGQLGGGRINCARALGVVLPPAPPTNFSAGDTPGDDGGSITLTWTKSADDGAGRDSVVAYRVHRKKGVSGSFAVIATLPKGSERYIDSGLIDGANYYYKVEVTDGTLSSETNVVGPVQSRNDASPLPVQGVRAMDRPNDSGGAIVIQWAAYTPPADFSAFCIYRSTSYFSSTAGMTPLAKLTEATATSYIDTQVSDGVDYYYAVGVRDTAGNEQRNISAVGPVQSYANTAVNFPAGLYFMASPATPADGDPATLFNLPLNAFAYARWAPALQNYQLDPKTRPLPEALQICLGRGFWIRFLQPVSFAPQGNTAPAGDFAIDLEPGWNQLGNPFFSPVDLQEATIFYNGATMDLWSADRAHVIAAFVWRYDTSQQAYSLAYPPLLSQSTIVPPWQGFWLLARQACQLILTRPSSTQGIAARLAAASAQSPGPKAAGAINNWQTEWIVPLRIQSNGACDSAAIIGVGTTQMLGQKPPAAQIGPQLLLSSPDSQEGQYAISVASHGRKEITWRLKVTNLQAGQPVELTAPDLSRLPADSIIILRDLATGESVYLRTASRYVLTPRAGEKERILQLTVSPRPQALLTIQGLVAYETPGAGAAVRFTLSQAAACTVTVLNIAGRPIRVLEEGKLRPAGNQLVLWDGRSALGTAAPAGLYLLQIKAKGPAGENVEAVAPLRLRR